MATEERIIDTARAQTSEKLTNEVDSLDRLHSMTKDELIALICQIKGIGYALMTEDEQYEAVCNKFLVGGMSEKEIWKALPPLKEWLDRRKGKAAQSISLDVKDTRMDKMPIDRLLRLAAMLDEPVIIAPMPDKLDD